MEWCDISHLELNVSKTKEMVVTFSNKQRDLAAAVTTFIHGKPVEYKYLGTIFDHLLKFSSNTEEILRRCQQRQYLLRKLISFGVCKDILLSFYYSFIESIVTFSITCWFQSTSLQNRNWLQSVVTVCSKNIGLSVRSLTHIYDQQTLRLASKIIKDPSHVLHSAFEWLPSGRWLRCPACRTQRRRATFVPKAILLLNSQT